jgi:hypothetical protein
MLEEIIVLAFIASMLVAGQMADARNRSVRRWVWATAIVGPLGPLALYIIGSRHSA